MAGKMNMSKMYGRKNEKTAPKKSPYIAPEMREEKEETIVEQPKPHEQPKPEKKERKPREKKEPANIGKELGEIKEVLQKAAEFEKQQPQLQPAVQQESPMQTPAPEPVQPIEQSEPEKQQVNKFSNTNFETTICFDPEMIVGYNIGVAKDYARRYGKTVFILNEDSNIFGLEKFMKQGIKRLPYLGINTAEKGDIICVDNKGLPFHEIVDYVCQHISDCLLMICSPVIREDDLMPILRKSKDGSGTDISVNAGTIGSIHSRLISRSNIFRFHHDPMFLQNNSAIDKFVRNTGSPELLMPFFVSQLAFEIRYNKETERWPDNEDEFKQTLRIGNPIYFIGDTRLIYNCEYELFHTSASSFIDAIREQIEASGEKAPSIEELAINMLDESELPQNILKIKQDILAQRNGAAVQQPEVQPQVMEQPKPQMQVEQPKAPEIDPMQAMVEELLGESIDDEKPVPPVNQEIVQDAPIVENIPVVEPKPEMQPTPPEAPEAVNTNLDAQFEMPEAEFVAGDKVSVEPIVYEIEGAADINVPESNDCYVRIISDVYGMVMLEHPNGLHISDFEEQIDVMSAADNEFAEITKQLDRSKKYALAPITEIKKV